MRAYSDILIHAYIYRCRFEGRGVLEGIHRKRKTKPKKLKFPVKISRWLATTRAQESDLCQHQQQCHLILSLARALDLRSSRLFRCHGYYHN